MADRPQDEKRPAVRAQEQLEHVGEPPVVARLVIEIRSDGSHTVARGALEDATEGVRVGIEARGTTPMELAASLTKAMFELPFLRTADRTLGALRRGVRALLPSRKSR